MRIVSWNMGANSTPKTRREQAWKHLLQELDPDIALVQEAVPPTWASESHDIHWQLAWPNSPAHQWGTGILVRSNHGLSPIQLAAPDTRFVAASVRVDAIDFFVASIHALTDMRGHLFEDQQGLKFVERLQQNFDAFASMRGDRFIVGGDLNSGRVAEETWPGYGHGAFWQGLDEAGFHSCPWSTSGEELITYRHPTGAFVGQADHILLDATTAGSAVMTAFVPPTESGVSDHLPLVVDLSSIPG